MKKQDILFAERESGTRMVALRRQYNQSILEAGGRRKPTVLVISMNNAVGRQKRKLLNYKFTHIPGVRYNNAPAWIKRRMRTNYGAHDVSPKKLHGRVGCFAAHVKALKYIIAHKLNRVIVCEDDAILSRKAAIDQVSRLPTDGACLIGGQTLRHPISFQANKTKAWHNVASKIERNMRRHRRVRKIDYDKVAWSGTVALYYPTWGIAKKVLDGLKGYPTRLTHIDVVLSNARLFKYMYPYMFNHIDHGTSHVGTPNTVICGFKMQTNTWMHGGTMCN